jgi:hypothetical protein
MPCIGGQPRPAVREHFPKVLGYCAARLARSLAVFTFEILILFSEIPKLISRNHRLHYPWLAQSQCYYPGRTEWESKGRIFPNFRIPFVCDDIFPPERVPS